MPVIKSKEVRAELRCGTSESLLEIRVGDVSSFTEEVRAHLIFKDCTSLAQMMEDQDQVTANYYLLIRKFGEAEQAPSIVTFLDSETSLSDKEVELAVQE